MNPGREGGAFTCIERLLSHKKTWLVQINHLPLRHLIMNMDQDGKSSSHNTSGPLGKMLPTVANWIKTRLPAAEDRPGLIELVDADVVDDITTTHTKVSVPYKKAPPARVRYPPVSST